MNEYNENIDDEKLIDLTGINTINVNGSTYINLEDLIMKGYLIKPDELNDKIIQDIYINQLRNHDDAS